VGQCQRCGTAFRPNAKFCFGCGLEISPTVKQNSGSQEAAHEKSNPSKRLVIAIIAVMIAGAAGAYYWNTLRGKDADIDGDGIVTLAEAQDAWKSLQKPKPGKWVFEAENHGGDLDGRSDSTASEDLIFVEQVKNHFDSIDTCKHKFRIEDLSIGGSADIVYSLFSDKFPMTDFGGQFHNFRVSKNSITFSEIYEFFKDGKRSYAVKYLVDGSFSEDNFQYTYQLENLDYNGSGNWEKGFSHIIRGSRVGDCPR
jgi:hypothetical protein